MKFIKLTDSGPSHLPVIINVDNIDGIMPDSDSVRIYVNGSNVPFRVYNTIVEVLDILERAGVEFISNKTKDEERVDK